ncbi:LssY C-terminal domain-containing protein [Mesorhizobium xinjiangense]|uniref:LssY C-terminal domain-containing protein n=1 Tax=Mesorhizobium xinjiangense TaxID=2678685 RepID=UPI0012ED3717|nr:LssY C-terminal domain-containing protein [Mesorhizobium xinjiangense]
MRRYFRTRPLAAGFASITILYLVAAYVALPYFWEGYDEHRPQEAMLTTTPQGIPGGPINVGLVGQHEDILKAFAAANWYPADPITLRSSLAIGISVVLDRTYDDAPVSTLIYDGRRQDLAFEKTVSKNPDRRHHVRLWQMVVRTGEDGRPLWLGAASFDQGIGFSHDTLQVTHYISADLDAERDGLIEDLETAGYVSSVSEIPGVGATTDGRNGEGDIYRTDGKALIAVLTPTEAQ